LILSILYIPIGLLIYMIIGVIFVNFIRRMA